MMTRAFTLFAVLVALAACRPAEIAPTTPVTRADSAMIAVIDGPGTGALWTCALPPIPAVVTAAGGPVPVSRVETVIVPGIDTARETVLGAFDYDHRRIEIRRSLVGLAAWQTLAHERIHVALFDASVTLGDQALEDRIADAIANQQVNDLLLAAQRSGRCRRHAR